MSTSETSTMPLHSTTSVTEPGQTSGSVGRDGRVRLAWRKSRFARFCVVGAVSAAVSVVLLYLLADIAGLHYLVAFAITFVAMNAGAYAVSRRFVFPMSKVAPAIGLLRYFGVTGFGLLVSTLSMALLVNFLGIGHIAAALVLAMLNAPVNFLMHRKVTFGIIPDR